MPLTPDAVDVNHLVAHLCVARSRLLRRSRHTFSAILGFSDNASLPRALASVARLAALRPMGPFSPFAINLPDWAVHRFPRSAFATVTRIIAVVIRLAECSLSVLLVSTVFVAIRPMRPFVEVTMGEHLLARGWALGGLHRRTLAWSTKRIVRLGDAAVALLEGSAIAIGI
jgi:hypothetical protein